MKNILLFSLVLVFLSCGQPSSDRPDFSPRQNQGELEANSDIYTSCTVNTFNKIQSFTVNIGEGETIIPKPIRTEFSQTRDLIEEYIFAADGFKAKLYLVLKTDTETSKSNIEEIPFDRNDKKKLVFYYDGEKALQVTINCTTNSLVTENHELVFKD